jgi:hypothetical protein
VHGVVDRPPRITHSRVGDRVSHDRTDVDRFHLKRAPLVEVSEQQQVIDEDAHPRGLGLDAAQGMLPRRDIGQRAAASQLGIPAHRRQRRAQLMTRVGHEVPQRRLAASLGSKRRLDLPEHCVQRAG